jgi:hypothetical protein
MMFKICGLMNTILRAIPFFYTITICLDFAFTKSSLKFFEWIKLESIYTNTYLSIQNMTARKTKFYGISMGLVERLIFGFILGIAQMLLLFAPFFLFYSTQNEYNVVENLGVSLMFYTGSSGMALYNSMSSLSNDQ